MTTLSEIFRLAQDIPKPRNRSEWEDRFAFWSTSASDTEEAKIEAATRQIKKAFENDRWLSEWQYTVIPQGSYRNNTNVRNDSDVDICVCLDEAVFYRPHPGETLVERIVGLPNISFSFKDYKLHIASVLGNYFGKDAVQTGNKAIALHTENTERISADVLPAFAHVLYESKAIWQNGTPIVRARGIEFIADTGEKFFNFPKQHTQNGIDKNLRTQRRYKRIVRILKRLRNHMRSNSILSASHAPSFLIESLVYNVSDIALNI